MHDSNIFEIILTNIEEEVYADSAYKNRNQDELLRDKGVRNRVFERAYKNTPLTSEQRVNNRINSGVRSIVERALSVLELHYGMSKARYLGMSQNKTHFGLMSLAYNIKRDASISMSSTNGGGIIVPENQ